VRCTLRAQQRARAGVADRRPGHPQRAVDGGVGEVEHTLTGEPGLQEQVVGHPQVPRAQAGRPAAAHVQRHQPGHAQHRCALEHAVPQGDHVADGAAFEVEAPGDPGPVQAQRGHRALADGVGAAEQTGQHRAADRAPAEVEPEAGAEGVEHLALGLGQAGQGYVGHVLGHASMRSEKSSRPRRFGRYRDQR
jgi:hypothetical protein